mgnify:FL=1
MSRLKEQYQNEIIDAMIKKFGYKNIMEVPKLDKVVINMGVGEAKDNAKLLDAAIADMEKITGQKAVVCKAKKSVANFKIREGMPIGCKVTLRGEKMYEFVDRLVNLALPRVRDFRGVNPNAFDGRGNYALGKELQTVERNLRKTRVGKVVSNKMDKTIVVAIEDHVKHPLYNKIVKKTYKLKAHDEKNDAKIGDTVRVMETRPLSKDKRWRLVEIMERAK